MLLKESNAVTKKKLSTEKTNSCALTIRIMHHSIDIAKRLFNHYLSVSPQNNTKKTDYE